MKQNYLSRMTMISFLFTSLAFAQNPMQIQQIQKETNVTRLNEISRVALEKAKLEKQEAVKLAAVNGWEINFIGTDGAYYELTKVSEGQPIYLKTDNTNAKKYSFTLLSNVTAARSTRADWMHKDGGLGLNVEGQGMTAYVWDGGIARATHQEYDGIGGSNRVTIAPSQGPLNFHAAHVMGTVVSSGFVAAAKGMAPQASGISYDWGSDDAEVATASGQGMLLSNHSYGFGANNIPDSWFGAYLADARIQDDIMFNAPYYLQVISAGNDGNNNTANGNPLDGNSSYDKLSGMKTAKNNMIVANAQDANIDENGNLVSVVINSGSSEGPTDDYRIKPDITGNGTGLFSTYESADDAYNTISGTSMSAPNVTGSMLLLQQHYSNLNGGFMRAATLKGLVLHTADDVVGSAGLEGPDTVHGWGLMNTKRAAETIINQGVETMIREIVINDGETLTFTVSSDETNPLLASISWTDAPGELSSGANDKTAALVNDLDIRVSKDSETFMPWRLSGVNTNEKGDNLVDPYERVDISGASGDYTITITHKGTLQGGSQNLSLIVTGIQQAFTITSTNSLVRDVCSDDSPTFEFDYRQTASTTTSLSLENAPNGVTASFSSNTLNANGTFDVTIEGLSSLDEGTYTVDVVADNGSKKETRSIQVTTTNPSESGLLVALSSPNNNTKALSVESIDLQWQETAGATNYTIEVSTSPSFETLVFSGEESSTTYTLSALEPNTIYYWRVKAENICQVGEYSDTFSFQTEQENCNNTFDASITSNTIGPLGIRTVSVNIDQSLIASRLKVAVDVTHNSIGDLEVQLRSPANLGTSTLTLLDNRCGNNADLSNVVFDDLGADRNCSDGTPTLSGAIKPEDALTAFRGEDVQGTWSIIFADFVNSSGSGTLNSASITVCGAGENTNIPALTFSGEIAVVANGPYVFKTSDIEVTTSGEGASAQLYTITQLPAKGAIARNGVNLAVGGTFTQEDVDNGLISFTNSETELFTDAFKVDITNGANGWLPNQSIALNATTLSNETFEIQGLSVYPNPSFGDVNIRLNPKTNNPIEVTLFDLQGRTILRKSFENNTALFEEKLIVGRLTNGVYLLNIQEGKYSSTKRVIISK